MNNAIKKQQNNNLVNIINSFIILFFCVNYIFTAVSEIIPYTFILVLEILCTVYCFLFENKMHQKIIIKYVILISVLTLLYYFFTKTHTVSEDVSNYNFKRFLSKFNQLVNFFFPIVLLNLFFKLQNKIYQGIVVLIVLICFLYVVIHSYFIFRADAELSRNWANFSELETDNVATYFFVYATSALIPIIFIFQDKNKYLYIKIISFIIILGLYVFLLSAQYTLAMIIPTICLFYAIIKNLKTKFKIIFILLLLLLLLFLPSLFRLLSDMVQSEDMKVRLMNIADLFDYRITKGSPLGGRLDLYKKCFEYFFYSPIIGNESVPFDGHATFLTVLCDLGIIGTVIVYSLYLGSHKDICRLLNNKGCYNEWMPCFLCMVLIGFTNPIHSASILGFVVYFMGPAILKLKERRYE